MYVTPCLQIISFIKHYVIVSAQWNESTGLYTLTLVSQDVMEKETSWCTEEEEAGEDLGQFIRYRRYEDILMLGTVETWIYDVTQTHCWKQCIRTSVILLQFIKIINFSYFLHIWTCLHFQMNSVWFRSIDDLV